MIKLNNNWDSLLKDEWNKPYYKDLEKFLEDEYQKSNIYPNKEDIFNAFRLTDYKDVKVVIIGQDPYHEPNQAHGLAFSVLEGVKLPKSLQNIYKEIENEFHYKMNNNGSLIKWANQGVLLLNSVLTVRENEANSHKNKGWEIFTDRIIKILNERKEPIIFVLWGNEAKKKQNLITNDYHFVLTSSHPSPLSSYHGFFGCNHFLMINKILKENKHKEIDWKI